jgi:wyosine [tRNA(Phe)-imidazoG37] synthetase (radical SAM superfamily)
LHNRFVYVVMSQRAGGLAVGVNLNPDKLCNFDCLYCEVNRGEAGGDAGLNPEAMATELLHTLQAVQAGRLRQVAPYSKLPPELLQLRHVALSGDGEPTLCPQFAQAVQAVVHMRALGLFPFFKIVLLTNASVLDHSPVQAGLKYFTAEDEIWAKLDAGSQAHMNRINRTKVPLDKVLANILALGRQRPVVIQTMFPAVNGEKPSEKEIEDYIGRLGDLKRQGAEISLVQIYSARRPLNRFDCRHLSLKDLSQIARQTRHATNLRVEVY